MYEDKTSDAIRHDILNDYGGSINTSEGSFASDMAAPVALEISKTYGAIDRALQYMFLDGVEGAELDLRAGEYGITRKPGVKATGSITINGTNGVAIPEGTAAMTDDGLRYLTDAAVTIADGSAAVTVTAERVGYMYNVSASQITRLYRNIIGVTAVTNTATAGGVDVETDDAMRARLLVRMRTPATSGNAFHYQNWALEVTGIGAAKVLPLFDGPGTVRVLVVSPEREPVVSEIVDACAAHIEEMRPIGADVTVVSALAHNITVTATVEVTTETTIAAVRTAFMDALTDYFRSVAFITNTISYNKITHLLMSVEGVVDFTALLVNANTINITIDDDSVPVLEGVTLSA